MKIDIITLHRTRNYGSVLQTYALQQALEHQNVKAEIIDYYPRRYSSLGLLQRLKYKSGRFKNPLCLFAARLLILPSYIKKKIVFDGYLKRYIHLTAKTYYREEELHRDCPKADAYCTGSDQVWNSAWNEGIDAPLYLSFIGENNYKFSYSASFGKSKLDNEEKNMIRPYFAQYRHLAVREKQGVELLRDMGFDNAVQVLDPTLLLEQEEWEQHASGKTPKGRYILTYNLHHDKNIDRLAKQISQDRKCRLYHISYNVHDVVRNGTLIWCPGVERFLSLIQHAEFVVTDSFHATVFSVMYEVPFVVLYPRKASSRLRSFLELTKLQDRGFDHAADVEEIRSDIDYRCSKKIIAEERDKAYCYLQQVIQEIYQEKIQQK